MHKLNPKVFIGPMSKNIVDSVIEYCEENNVSIGLIPSRRQIEFNGGYVNNWTTKEFCEYVRSKTDKVLLVRDHAGPLQGYTPDQGLDSFYEDCQSGMFDLIHVDVWKKYPSYSDGLAATLSFINLGVSLSETICFEIGTEEAIRPFTAEELDNLISDLKKYLSDSTFKRIKYAVIQSGTALKGNVNIGSYNQDRLNEMIAVVDKHGLISKEHNGDYLPTDLVKAKFDAGLDCINIAPEFGNIETKVILDVMKSYMPQLINEFYKICYDSKRWVKWVPEGFDPDKNKEEIINICGHYVFSDEKFIKIRNILFDSRLDLPVIFITDTIKNKIKEKLAHLC